MIEEYTSLTIRCDTPECGALKKYQRYSVARARAHAERLGWYIGEKLTACPKWATRAVAKRMAEGKRA